MSRSRLLGQVGLWAWSLRAWSLGAWFAACGPTTPHPIEGGSPPESPDAQTPDVPRDPADASGPSSEDSGAIPVRGLRAFPGAEGFGAVATGGRGGRVVYVTNLNLSGPGSLQDALAQSGPRYVLFKVSGVIPGSVYLAQGDVTIAGQTSPGGITVRGIYTGEANYCGNSCVPTTRGVDNIVLRYLRSRPSNTDTANAEQDGLRIRFARKVMVDHLSIGNALDEAVEISSSNQVTISNTILAETIGDHAERGGMLLNYSNPDAGYALDQITIVRNVWNRILGRYPELSRESPAAAGSTLRIELSNNLIWDQQYFIEANPTIVNDGDLGKPGIYYAMNWVGNLGFARPRYAYGMIFLPNPSGRSTAYFNDNHLNLYSDRADYKLQYCCSDFRTTTPPATKPAWARDARHPFPEITYLPSTSVRLHVFENAGCFPRDPMDRRLMGPVAGGSVQETAVNVNPANDAFRFDWTTPPAPPTDSDLDGMPDDWERENGLDPSAQDHNGLDLSRRLFGVDGYTNLECYLEKLAQRRRLERPLQ